MWLVKMIPDGNSPKLLIFQCMLFPEFKVTCGACLSLLIRIDCFTSFCHFADATFCKLEDLIRRCLIGFCHFAGATSHELADLLRNDLMNVCNSAEAFLLRAASSKNLLRHYLMNCCRLPTQLPSSKTTCAITS